MAQHGGSLPPVRVVSPQPTTRPAASHRQQQPPSAASSAGTTTSRDVITLSQPRPGSCRVQNEYIDTPIRPQIVLPKSSRPHHHHHQLKENSASPLAPNVGDAGEALHHAVTSAGHHTPLPGVHRSPLSTGHNRRLGIFSNNTQVPITTQPSATFKKDKLNGDTGSDGSEGAEADSGHGESIICRQCGRCKCDSCRNPRPLPSRWICNDKYLCSAQTMVDYCSCMCCVKGLYYHWAKDYEMDNDVSCADKPCSCVPHQRCLRWGCLSLLSTVLPCLCCYWPLRGCVKLCEMCYAKLSSHGCRCSQRRTTNRPPEQAPEKRLLDSNSDC